MTKFQGQTAAAKAAASRALGRPVDQLRVTVLDPGRRGFLGLGRRLAVIEAEVEKPVPVEKPAPTPQPVPREGEAGPVREVAVTKEKPATPKNSVGPDSAAPLTPEEQAARHEKNLAQLRAALPGLTDYLNGIYRALGVAAVATVKEARLHSVVVDLETASPGRVIGHHGRRINAVEELATAWLDYHGVADPGLVLDTAGYRARRSQVVADIATETAIEVVATGRAVFLDPMPARERRAIHQRLAKNGKVRTYSRGREPFRAVVIAPK